MSKRDSSKRDKTRRDKRDRDLERRQPPLCRAPQSRALDMCTLLSHLEPIYRTLSENSPIYNHTICIEGNIGSGKSTLIKSLEKPHGYEVYPEPVQQRWGQFLPILYKDPARWGMCFQMEVLDWFHSLKETFNQHAGRVADKLKDAREKKSGQQNIWISKQDLIIVERSPQSAFEIFTLNLHDCGLLTDWEKSLLLRFYHLTRWRPAKVFYLRTPPEICCQRIKERSRKGEDSVDEPLIQQLHNKHEDLYLNQENVVVIDGTAEQKTVLSQLLKELQKFHSSS